MEVASISGHTDHQTSTNPTQRGGRPDGQGQGQRWTPHTVSNNQTSRPGKQDVDQPEGVQYQANRSKPSAPSTRNTSTPKRTIGGRARGTA